MAVGARLTFEQLQRKCPVSHSLGWIAAVLDLRPAAVLGVELASRSGVTMYATHNKQIGSSLMLASLRVLAFCTYRLCSLSGEVIHTKHFTASVVTDITIPLLGLFHPNTKK